MPRPAKKAASKIPTVGFGFQPSVTGHHFTVTIGSKSEGRVYLTEHFHFDDSEERRKVRLALGHDADKLRCVLSLAKWETIAPAVQDEFNQRLKILGQKSSRWLQSQTLVSRLLGKELVLLAWAVEEADPTLIPAAISNWKGLSPEERWWLFTMTNAATGHAINGRGRGWRKAVRFALTENPNSSQPSPEGRKDMLGLVAENETPYKI